MRKAMNRVPFQNPLTIQGLRFGCTHFLPSSAQLSDIKDALLAVQVEI